MESRFNVVSVASTSGAVEVMETGNFQDFGLSEEYVEKLLSSGVMLNSKNDLKIVGRQVFIPDYKWKPDLIALRRDGTLVIIEVKRDKEDMERRKEPCEIQVIRYAACLTDLRTVEDIVDSMYADFAAKNVVLSDTDETLRNETVRDDLIYGLNSWLHRGAAVNNRQELVLVASGFDAGTLLACEWMAHRGIVITCMQVSPFKNAEGKLLLVVDKVFPIASVKDMIKKPGRKITVSPDGSTRNAFPSTADMFEAGLLKEGQTVYLKGSTETATVIDGNYVQAGASAMRWNEWAKKYRTGSFSLYQYVCVDSAKVKTLHDLRTKSETSTDISNQVDQSKDMSTNWVEES